MPASLTHFRDEDLNAWVPLSLINHLSFSSVISSVARQRPGAKVRSTICWQWFLQQFEWSFASHLHQREHGSSILFRLMVAIIKWWLFCISQFTVSIRFKSPSQSLFILTLSNLTWQITLAYRIRILSTAVETWFERMAVEGHWSYAMSPQAWRPSQVNLHREGFLQSPFAHVLLRLNIYIVGSELGVRQTFTASMPISPVVNGFVCKSWWLVLWDIWSGPLAKCHLGPRSCFVPPPCKNLNYLTWAHDCIVVQTSPCNHNIEDQSAGELYWQCSSVLLHDQENIRVRTLQASLQIHHCCMYGLQVVPAGWRLWRGGCNVWKILG